MNAGSEGKLNILLVIKTTIRIKDGDLIEVDGTNGIVKIIEEAK